MFRRKRRRGSALVEFTFTGVPLIFVWLSTVQIALGMWHYHTMQYAVKTTGSFLSMHGSDCASPNTCAVTIANLAAVMKYDTIGIPPSALQMTFNAVSAADHKTVTSSVTCLLTNATTPASGCDQNTTPWLPTGSNTPGSEFEIQALFQWNAGIGMVAPGAGANVKFGSFLLPAYTHQMVLF
ncbi:MAG: TadE family protein [Bryobacteraceae bacterium]|jgi:Flp pilus assembly protein TadG